MPAPVQTPTKSPVVTTFPPEPLKLQDIGDNGSPLAAFPLGECEGDCDVDTDCEVNKMANAHLLNLASEIF